MKLTTRIKYLLKGIWDSQGWRPLNVGGNGEHKNTLARNYLAEYMSWVSANVKAIARSIAAIEFKLMRVDGDDVVEVTTHPFLELLYKPNPFFTKSDFIKQVVTFILMTGEAPIRLKRLNPQNINELPNEMWVEVPTDLTVNVGKDEQGFELLTGYKLYKDMKEYQLNPWELILINNPNPNDPWRGIGIIEEAAKTIDQLTYAEEYNLNFFKNSAVPSVALYTEQKLGKETFDRLRESWASSYQGHDNAHKTAILEAGLKIEKLQQSVKDMDFVEQQKFMRDKLMAMFGTTKVILGITEDVNRANAEASEYVFSKYTVKPLMDQICEYLNEFLLPVFDKTGTLFLTYEDPTPENKEEKVNLYDKAVNRWMTVNEIRREEGLPDIDGGDELKPAQPSTTPLTAPKQDMKSLYKEDIAKLENRNLRRKQIIAEMRKAVKKALKSKKVTPKYKGVKYKDARQKDTIDKFVNWQMSKAVEYDKTMATEIEKIYAWQEKEIVKKLNAKGKDVKELLFDKSASIKLGIDLTTPIIEAMILEYGAEAFDMLGISGEYSVLASARRYLKQQPKKYSKSMTETAYERARGIIEKGIEKGESIPKLVRAIKDEYEQIKKNSTENLVRTEVTRAFNFATEDAYVQSGVVEGKEWLATGDDRLCEFCAAMEAETNKSLGEAWFAEGDTITGEKGGSMTVSYSDIDSPPLHCSCRCTIIPVFEPIKSVQVETKEEKLPDPDELLKSIEAELDGIRKE